jgi:phytoene synthase
MTTVKAHQPTRRDIAHLERDITRSPAIAASFKHCRAVTRQRATNFFYAMRMTPEPKRSAMYALYAALRACDDAVDDAPNESGRTEAHRRAAIDRFERQFECTRLAVDEAALPPGRIWPALCCIMHHYDIDPTLFHSVIQGQRDDLDRRPIADFDELCTYCYRVASTVGLLCITIWGHDNAPSVPYLAKCRGIALQLTNILRDLREDAANSRVYLPANDIRAFRCRPERWPAGFDGGRFEQMMQFQIERARGWYEASRALEAHITPDCRATSSAIEALYRGTLERIAADPPRVLRERVRLTKMEKLRLVSRAWWTHRNATRHGQRWS